MTPSLVRALFLCGLTLITWMTTSCTTITGPTSSSQFRLFVAPQTVRSDEVTLLWDKVDSTATESGVAVTYQVLLDDKPLAATPKTHFTVKELLPARDHVFVVKAQTSSGQVAQRSNVVRVKTRPRETMLSVEAFGAKGDGTTLNTKAIQAAIDACPPNGVVLIPEGVFLSGALYLKSDMTLKIARDGVLKGSADPQDYLPFNRNRFEGWEMETHASLLNAGKLDRNGPANVRNLSIRGEGRISGGGRKLSDTIRRAFPGIKGVRARGRLILLMNAENVEVAGLTLEETPCWTLHYIYSENVSLHGLTIRSDVFNGDGIDPDSSRNSYIFNCTFDTGDDCIAVKSGKNPEGNVVNRPTENVWIVDCNFIRGHGISIGSEMSGGIRNVLVQDCVAGALLNGMQIKATKDRGGVVENVTVRDCNLQKITVLTALAYNNDGEPAPEPPYFRNFRFVNLDLSTAKPDSAVVIVNGFTAAGHRTKDIRFENVKLPRGAIVKVEDSEDVTFEKVTTPGGAKPQYEVSRSERVTY
ncbi:MAG TPA: glycoside hydrolase family 28 protein [Opitutaceae bacterium]|nr:glycoside hydrolase family 28 protein [Opitutaceae bacterium]